MKRCVGRRGGEVKEIHGDETNICRRQYQGREMHIRLCVKIVLRRISGGIKA